MIKRVPTRNPRSKGIKVKNVLHICLLLGVCFWLIYQVKRSHDKKKESEENEVKGMINADNILKYGRKDLHPRVPVLNKNDKQEDDEDDEVGAIEDIRKEDDNKLDQEQEEAEMKHREEEEEEEEEGLDEEPMLRAKETEEKEVNKEEERGQESRSEEVEEGPEEEGSEEDSKKEQMKEDNDDAGDGDDDIDEHNQDKIEGEDDHDEEPKDEDKEAQESEEEEIDVAKGEGQVNPDHETSVEDHDLDGGDQDLDGGERDLDGGDQNAHEAREEIYKADDASSAVTHDTRTLNTESENVNQDHSEKNSAINDLVVMTDITTNGTEGVHGDHDQKSQSLNMTPANDEKLLANSDDQSVRGNMNTSAELNVVGGLLTSKGNNTVTRDISQHDGAEINLESQSHNETANGLFAGDSTKLNTTVLGQESNKTETDGAQHDPDKDSSSPSTHLESNASRMNIKPEVTAEGPGLSSTDKTQDDTHSDVPVIASDNAKDATQGDNPENTSESGGADENHGDSNADSKGENEERHDPDHSSDPEISQDENESRIDLGTLPESNSDGVNDRNAAEAE